MGYFRIWCDFFRRDQRRRYQSGTRFRIPIVPPTLVPSYGFSETVFINRFEDTSELSK